MIKKYSIIVLCILVLFCTLFAASASESYKLFKKISLYHNHHAYIKALRLSQKYLLLYPQGNEASAVYFQMQSIYRSRQEYDRAINICQQHISAFPNNESLPSLYLDIADLYEHIGNKEKALTWYIFIIENYPDTLYSEYAHAALDINYGVTLSE